MSLRIRRGTDAQRQTALLDQGELAYTTDTHKLFIGDGATSGGVNVLATAAGTGLIFDQVTQTLKVSGSNTVVEADTAPSLGGNLNLNSHNITGTGNININGNITANILSTSTISIASDGSIISTNVVSASYDPALYIGSNSRPNTLFINSTKSFLQLNGIIGNSGGSPNLSSKISRGTLSAPLAVHSNDPLILNQIYGYDGTNYTLSGVYGVAVDPASSVATGSVPGTFFARTVGTSGTKLLTFNSSGVLSVPVVLTGSFNGSGAYPTPTAGMIIFDSSTKNFVGYNGTSWVQLNN